MKYLILFLLISCGKSSDGPIVNQNQPSPVEPTQPEIKCSYFISGPTTWPDGSERPTDLYFCENNCVEYRSGADKFQNCPPK